MIFAPQGHWACLEEYLPVATAIGTWWVRPEMLLNTLQGPGQPPPDPQQIMFRLQMSIVPHGKDLSGGLILGSHSGPSGLRALPAVFLSSLRFAVGSELCDWIQRRVKTETRGGTARVTGDRAQHRAVTAPGGPCSRGEGQPPE